MEGKMHPSKGIRLLVVKLMTVRLASTFSLDYDLPQCGMFTRPSSKIDLPNMLATANPANTGRAAEGCKSFFFASIWRILLSSQPFRFAFQLFHLSLYALQEMWKAPPLLHLHRTSSLASALSRACIWVCQKGVLPDLASSREISLLRLKRNLMFWGELYDCRRHCEIVL